MLTIIKHDDGTYEHEVTLVVFYGGSSPALCRWKSGRRAVADPFNVSDLVCIPFAPCCNFCQTMAVRTRP